GVTGLVDRLDGLAVEEQLFLLADVRVGRPRGRRIRRRLPGRRAHAGQHVLVRDDPGADAGARADVATGDRAAQLADRVVAAHVIRVRARVDDVANRLVGQATDRRHDLVGVRRGPGVHEQDAIVADLERDVAAGSNEHVDVALHFERVKAV